jgi:surface polysaccharide O-acyltransferase-like enzyme
METSSAKVAAWFKVVAAIAVLWNIIGVLAFLMNVFITDETLAALSEAERALYEQYPLWATIVFAIAVFGGLFGSIGLLMRKKWSKQLLMVSLIAICVQMYHNLFMSEYVAVTGNSAYFMPALLVVIAIFLLYLSAFANRKGWLN